MIGTEAERSQKRRTAWTLSSESPFAGIQFTNRIIMGYSILFPSGIVVKKISSATLATASRNLPVPLMRGFGTRKLLLQTLTQVAVWVFKRQLQQNKITGYFPKYLTG